MGKVKRAAEDKAELAMMGKFVSVESEEEVNFITNYILTALDKEELFRKFDSYDDHTGGINIYSEIQRFNKTNKVTYMGTNRVLDMPCIVYCLEVEDAPKPFEEDYGTGNPAAFCYVFNLVDHDMCSEFGDCFFEKRVDGYFHRVS